MNEFPEHRASGAAAPQPRTWQTMRERTTRLLEERTGDGVEAWNQRVTESGLDDEAALRDWLGEQGVTGYPQTLLVWERFGYPGYITASADELIGRQYADRPHLRPVLDAILAALPAVGDVAVQARKTYISLVAPRRTFAVVQSTTKSRIDLGLRLEGQEPSGRLQSARAVGNGTMTVRVGLASPDDLDQQAIGWLKRAYEENS